MDVNKLLKSASNRNTSETETDKKVYIKSFKEKGKYKTEVIGLNYYLKQVDLDDFCKEVKKKLGCDCNKKNEKDKQILIFSGDHVEWLTSRLTEKNIVSKENIR